MERPVRLFRYATIALSVLSLSLPVITQAADAPGDNYVSLMATAISADEDRSVKNGVGGAQLGLGRVFHEHWNIEGAFGFINTSADSGGNDQEQIYLNANALNIYNRNGNFQPYLLGGLGIMRTTSFDVPDETNVTLSLGGGALIPIYDDKVKIRGEILYRAESGTSFADLLVNVGIVIPFGAPAPAPAPVVEPKAAPAVAAVSLFA